MSSDAQPYFLKARGYWCFNVYVDGKRVRRKFADTKSEAFALWKNSIRARSEGAVGNPPLPDVSDQWVLTQIERYKDGEVSDVWLARVTRTIKAFTESHPMIHALEVTPQVLYKWMAGRLPNTRRTEYSDLRQCLRWAFKNKLIAEDPLVALEMSGMQSRKGFWNFRTTTRFAVRPIATSRRSCEWPGWSEAALENLVNRSGSISPMTSREPSCRSTRRSRRFASRG